MTRPTLFAAMLAPRIPMLLAGLLLAGVSAPALATQLPVRGIADPRVAVVDYTPDDVVLITATLGYAVTLDFGEDEKIETVSVGDGLNWQLTPNRHANLLFVKAMAPRVTTNMTVVTALRVYHFELRAQPRSVVMGRRHGRRNAQPLFAVRFTHPAPAMVAPAADLPPPPPVEANASYSYDGARGALPVKVFDDGTSTYFKFSDSTDIPAIMAIDRDGKEALVNIANRDGYVVADRVAPAFVLRRGAIVTRVFNDGFHEDTGQPSQLRPRGRHDRDRRPAPGAPQGAAPAISPPALQTPAPLTPAPLPPAVPHG